MGERFPVLNGSKNHAASTVPWFPVRKYRNHWNQCRRVAT